MEVFVERAHCRVDGVDLLRRRGAPRVGREQGGGKKWERDQEKSGFHASALEHVNEGGEKGRVSGFSSQVPGISQSAI